MQDTLAICGVVRLFYCGRLWWMDEGLRNCAGGTFALIHALRFIGFLSDHSDVDVHKLANHSSRVLRRESHAHLHVRAVARVGKVVGTISTKD